MEQELTETEYRSQMREAKDYALRSLTCREQTEYQLSEKLRRREYADAVIRDVIHYLKEYNYINDDRFLEQYIAGHCQRMNRVQMERKLYSYGFRHLRLDEYLRDCDYDETRILYSQFQAYTRQKNLDDPIIRKKVAAHFVNKGFSYETVRGLMNDWTMKNGI